MSEGRSSIIKINPRFKAKPNKQEGIINYDVDNAYPQRVLDIVAASSVAAKCTDVYAKFIMGNGFTDTTFYKAVINSDGETVDMLLRKVALDRAYFRGFAIHINFDGNGQITELRHVPFEFCRFAAPKDEFDKPKQIKVYEDWGKQKVSRILKERIKTYDIYGTVDVEKLIVDGDTTAFDNYSGQIFYYSPEGLCYPTATADSVLEDCVTDSEIKVYKWRAVSTNFMASHIYVDRLKYESEEQRAERDTALTTFQGGDNAGKIMCVESPSEEYDPKILKVDQQNFDKQFEYTEKSIQDNIRFAYGIPSVLIGKEVAGKLGSSSEITEAVEYYNIQTADERLVFEETFKFLCSNFATTINQSGDYSIIPRSYKFTNGTNTV